MALPLSRKTHTKKVIIIAIGERIRYFRRLRGLTQKELGLASGLEAKGAESRIAQYEMNYRVPKKALLERIAQALDVSPCALSATNIDSCVGVIYTLFALEDNYGFKTSKISEAMCISSAEIGEKIKAARKAAHLSQTELAQRLNKTMRTVQKYESGEIEPSIAMINSIAQILDVSPINLIGYQNQESGEVCLKVDVRKSKDAARLHKMIWAWQEQAAKLEAGEISQEEYDRWRYHYPQGVNEHA